MKKLFIAISAATLLLSGLQAQADSGNKYVNIKVLAPKSGELAGVGSRAFMVDLVARFNTSLAATGASPELTGPGPLANAGPFPGTFSPGANKDHFPGLVVLLSSTHIGAGPGHNTANLFNIVGITDQTDSTTDVWTSWIIGAPNAFGTTGAIEDSTLFAAVVEGTAPDVVSDMDGNGKFDEKDLALMGYRVISNSVNVDFQVNGF